MQNRIRGFAFLLGCVLVLSGCTIKPKFLASDYVPPRSIALLPMGNQTNDMDGPEVVRNMMFKYLPRRGYYSIPIDRIDEILKKNGITQGGQLYAITPEKLGQELGVDALMYGELLEFGTLNIGFYRRKQVEASFKIVDAGTGKVLWEDVRKVSTKKFALDADAAKRAFAEGLAEKVVGKMLNIHLKAETRECIRRIVSTLPPK